VITNNICPACGMEATSPTPNPLNLPGRNDGIAVTMGHAATGEVLAQRWHASCRDAERRRAQRRAGIQPEPAASADLLDDIREALQ
jgi:hypothetical protein